MQRRAAAIYAAFFVVLAAGAYGVVGLAQEPTVSVDDPTHSLSANDTLEADDRTYTVGEIQNGTNDGNDLRSTELSWVNESARYTASLENNSTVPAAEVQWDGQTAENEPYRLLVTDGADPSSFELTQEFNVSQRLREDAAVENETVTRADGQRYVVYRENGTTQPLAGYLPEPERREFTQGDALQYRNNQTQVDEVTNQSVTLAWTAPRSDTISLEEGGTTTLGETEYVAHFPDNSTLELSTDVDGYDRQAASIETYHERMSGLRGISIVSGLAAVLLLATAYLPSRY